MKLDKFNNFILERRISQISSNIEITFGFDIIKTKHSEERSDFTQRDLGYNYNISNQEITQFVEFFKDEISQHIANGEIGDCTKFVLRSDNLSMAVEAEEVSPKYWKLIIITIFPNANLKAGYNQLVLTK